MESENYNIYAVGSKKLIFSLIKNIRAGQSMARTFRNKLIYSEMWLIWYDYMIGNQMKTAQSQMACEMMIAPIFSGKKR